jgi:hypothetical protein
MMLVSYNPFAGNASPYRSSSAIFLHAEHCAHLLDRSPLPLQLTRRTLSLQAFDSNEYKLDAKLIDGIQLADALGALAMLPNIHYVDIHNAIRGCWAARAYAE